MHGRPPWRTWSQTKPTLRGCTVPLEPPGTTAGSGGLETVRPTRVLWPAGQSVKRVDGWTRGLPGPLQPRQSCVVWLRGSREVRAALRPAARPAWRGATPPVEAEQLPARPGLLRVGGRGWFQALCSPGRWASFGSTCARVASRAPPTPLSGGAPRRFFNIRVNNVPSPKKQGCTLKGPKSGFFAAGARVSVGAWPCGDGSGGCPDGSSGKGSETQVGPLPQDAVQGSSPHLVPGHFQTGVRTESGAFCRLRWPPGGPGNQMCRSQGFPWNPRGPPRGRGALKQ